MPSIDELTLGRARVYPSPYSPRRLIVLPVKEKPNIQLDQNILNECVMSLLDVITELNLRTISMSKTDELDTIPWHHILLSLQDILSERPLIITICHGLISIPLKDDRQAII